LAVEFDLEAERLGFRTLAIALRAGDELTFKLMLPGFTLIEPEQQVTWNQETEGVAFGIEVPQDCPVGNAIGTMVVMVNSLPVGRITFKFEVRALGEAKTARMDALDAVSIAISKYKKAFLSHAREDRNHVLGFVQGFRFTGIDFFLDVLHIKAGEVWADELYRHIDHSDLFVLFWSSHASESDWVEKEWRYAIALKNGQDDAPPEIHPVVVRKHPFVPPPPELKHLQFNDYLVRLMDQDEDRAE
jgi:hypothetical protein